MPLAVRGPLALPDLAGFTAHITTLIETSRALNLTECVSGYRYSDARGQGYWIQSRTRVVPVSGVLRPREGPGAPGPDPRPRGPPKPSVCPIQTNRALVQSLLFAGLGSRPPTTYSR